VLVDMEEGVLGELLRGPLGALCTAARPPPHAPAADLFKPAQLLAGTSGSGNNWARGARHYGARACARAASPARLTLLPAAGPHYREALMEQVRCAVEACDSPQAFLLLHSLGGGTGSGVGSFLLQELQDAYPALWRVAAPLLPASLGDAADDVVTSPYNTVMALRALAEHTDIVLPFCNAALGEAAAAAAARRARAGAPPPRPLRGAPPPKPFDAANGAAARALLDLLASNRWPGSLNTDLSELSTNLVPYPRLHFLVASAAEATAAALRLPRAPPPGQPLPSRAIDALFSDAMRRDAQLLRTPASEGPGAGGTYLASALLLRGAVAAADARRCAALLAPQLRLATWLPRDARGCDLFKLGLCGAPPAGAAAGLLTLSNTTAVAGVLSAVHWRFGRLRGRRAHLHHYQDFLPLAEMDEAAEALAALVDQYAEIDSAAARRGAGGVARGAVGGRR